MDANQRNSKQKISHHRSVDDRRRSSSREKLRAGQSEMGKRRTSSGALVVRVRTSRRLPAGEAESISDTSNASQANSAEPKKTQPPNPPTPPPPAAPAATEPEIQLDAKTEAVFRKKNYKIMGRLGKGAFGQVFKACRLNDTNEIVAVKMLELSQMGDKFREKYVPRELAALIECRHDNVVHIYDIIRASNRLFIFMEYAGNGTLADYVRANGALPEKRAHGWFTQVVNALSYVHQKLRLAHRDIKLDNILLNQEMDAKLTDFGFAKYSWNSRKHCVNFAGTFVGTPPYLCPQILNRTPYNPFLGDCWAMGVMLYAMTNNRFPFHFQDQKVMLLEQTNYPAFISTRFLPTVPEGVRDLVMRFLDPNERTRLSLSQAFKHKWINPNAQADNEQPNASSLR